MRWTRLAATLLLLGLAAAPAAAQSGELEQCSDDLTLVLRNPDLKRDAAGYVHAQGSLFVQFSAIGARADDIATFGFSFGPVESPIEDDSGICDAPPQGWATGAYVINYRADQNPDDGFFINLQTDLVPDGNYAAAVHAYDADYNEIARAWTNAIVDNCDGDAGSRCEGNEAQIQNQDQTMPWPIILPGDGDPPLDVSALQAQEGTAEVPLDAAATLVVEFAERLSALNVTIQDTTTGQVQDISAQLQPWSGRVWDDDLVPGYGPFGLGGLVVPECSQQPPQTCNHLGEAHQWLGRPLTVDDVVRVEATDLAGNVALKEIHVGSGAAIVTDDVPNIVFTIDATTKSAAPGQSVIFHVTMLNTGGTTAHPFTSAAAPAGWQAEWLPHEPLEPGAEGRQELTVTVPADAADGQYPVTGSIRYQAGGEDRGRTWSLNVTVGEGGPGGNETTTETDEQESPWSVVVAGVALAAVAIRRRGRA